MKRWPTSSLALLAGVNLLIVVLTVVPSFQAHATVGAITPFISFEGESGALGNGAAIVSVTSSPTTQFSSPEMEASGHAYVQLTNTGQYILWTNTTSQSFTAINLRSCIPDAPTGGGITSTIDLYVNGVFRQAFSVNSQQNYCYEGTNYNGQTDKNPADGDPRGFWNDTHAFIAGAPIHPGDTFSFQKDASNGAAFYYIDVVDLEAPPPPLPQPPSSLALSITSFGAVSNDITVDNTTAINSCFTAALQQGKSAWIPPGTFYFSAVHGGLNASGINIAGAGMWYSTLYRVTPTNNNQGVNNMVTTTSCTLSNVALDCNGSSRAGNNNNGAINFSGNNWVVDSVWVQHVTSAFWCAGIGGTARNCRVLSVWSDGGNFNNVQSANGIGMNLTYSNNFVRGTGDDAMAINSVNYNVFGTNTYYYTMMSNITYANNTAIAPWGGKCMGIYGGINDMVTNNLLLDTARYTGLGVMKFGVNGSDLLSATVTGNVMLRCGGNGYNQQQQAMMIGNGSDGQGVGTVANAYCASNTIINSLYDAIGFSSSSNIVLQYNTIVNPAMDAIAIGPPDLGSAVLGNALIYSNSVTGLNSGRVNFTNSASGYAGIVPIPATNFNSMSGIITQPCAEGGFEIGGIVNGDWAAYNNLNLTGSNAFVSRVASAGNGGNIEIHLDSPGGTLIGICAVSGTGSSNTYSNAYGNIIPTAGIHSIYLVFTGGPENLFSVEYFGLFAAPPVLSHQLIPGNVYSLNALVNGKYVTAPNSGSNALIASSASVGTAEQFKIIDAGGGRIGFQAMINSNYVSADNNGNSPLIANRTAIGLWETFTEFDAGGGKITVRAANNGKYVTAANNGTSPLIASSTAIGTSQSYTAALVSGVPPVAPGALTANPGNSVVNLSWVVSPGASGYNIKRSTTNGGPYSVIASNLNALAFSDASVTNATNYFYVASALNSVGESANSPQAYAVPGTLNRLAWTTAASSTESGGSSDNAIDGNIATRWSTGASQTNGQWFQVDMGVVNTFYRLILDASGSPGDYPRGYQVSLSNDGITWSAPVASGSGSSAVTTISFPTNAARYIRITQTGSTSGWWSIHEFNVVPGAPLAPTNLVATAGDGQVVLNWSTSYNATGYNVKRSTSSNGVFSVIASNVPGLFYTSTGLTNGSNYYFTVSALNSVGEGGNSTIVNVRPVSSVPPQLSFAMSAGQLRLTWPSDHLGWKLQAQTNAANAGIGSNWVTIATSSGTNQIVTPINTTNGSVFFRMLSP